jgi:predicted dehydrogenase
MRMKSLYSLDIVLEADCVKAKRDITLWSSHQQLPELELAIDGYIIPEHHYYRRPKSIYGPRTCHKNIVDGELKTDIENIAEPVDMNAYDINHWIDAIQNDGEPAVLPEQAATVTRVLEAIYESAATGKTIVFV